MQQNYNTKVISVVTVNKVIRFKIKPTDTILDLKRVLRKTERTIDIADQSIVAVKECGGIFWTLVGSTHDLPNRSRIQEIERQLCPDYYQLKRKPRTEIEMVVITK